MVSDQSDPTTWIKASKSDSHGTCVEMRRRGAGVEVRDSKHGDASPILRLTPAGWGAWLGGAKEGELDHLL